MSPLLSSQVDEDDNDGDDLDEATFVTKKHA